MAGVECVRARLEPGADAPALPPGTTWRPPISSRHDSDIHVPSPDRQERDVDDGLRAWTGAPGRSVRGMGNGTAVLVRRVDRRRVRRASFEYSLRRTGSD